MSHHRVIAFAGPAGSGKSTAARRLVERHGFFRVAFADPIKAMLRHIGLTDAHLYGELKEVPSPLLGGRTPRYALQTLGTEWGRQMVSMTLWTDVWRETTAGLLIHGGLVVCDDVRFPEEAAAVREAGGVVVSIAGRGGIPGDHVSEAGVAGTDVTIVNDGDKAVLHAAVDALLLIPAPDC